MYNFFIDFRQISHLILLWNIIMQNYYFYYLFSQNLLKLHLLFDNLNILLSISIIVKGMALLKNKSLLTILRIRRNIFLFKFLI
jgi:hypothetical protein